MKDRNLITHKKRAARRPKGSSDRRTATQVGSVVKVYARAGTPGYNN